MTDEKKIRPKPASVVDAVDYLYDQIRKIAHEEGRTPTYDLLRGKAKDKDQPVLLISDLTPLTPEQIRKFTEAWNGWVR